MRKNWLENCDEPEKSEFLNSRQSIASPTHVTLPKRPWRSRRCRLRPRCLPKWPSAPCSRNRRASSPIRANRGRAVKRLKTERLPRAPTSISTKGSNRKRTPVTTRARNDIFTILIWKSSEGRRNFFSSYFASPLGSFFPLDRFRNRRNLECLSCSTEKKLQINSFVDNLIEREAELFMKLW